MEISGGGVGVKEEDEEGWGLRVWFLMLEEEEEEEGISLGSWVDVMGAGSASSCALGDGGGVGGALGPSNGWEGCGLRVAGFASSTALMRFSRPLRLGTR